MAAAVRAAARTAPNIVEQVARRGGPVPRADVNAGALMANIRLHVAARCGAVATANVSVDADGAKVGRGPVDAGRGRRTRGCVC